jgi:bifunctional ADP-heptose synthase (sugar kinase/adenylyltransferase)
MVAPAKERQKTVLVVGDVNIDVAWSVEPALPGSTSQAHGGVEPEKLVEPKRRMEVLGSAGTIARAVCMADPNVKVILVGGWAEDSNLLKKNLVPELERNKPASPHIQDGQLELRRLVQPPFTRVLTRVYSRSEDGKELYDKRYDREVLDGSWERDADFAWPEPSDVDVVIVGDYNKGLLTQKGVLQDLKIKYDRKPFILRAKRRLEDAVIQRLPWKILCPNRQDFFYLLSRDRRIDRALQKVAKRWSCHPDILDGLQELSSKIKGRTILLKLDSEGAALLEEGRLTIFPLAKNSTGKWAGIGAGDTLMARLAVELCRNSKILLKNAVPQAVKAASAYCREGEDLRRVEGWYGTTTGVEEKKVNKIEFDGEPNPLRLTEAIKDWRTASSYPKLLNPDRPLVMEDAEWYLPGFLTVDSKFGEDVLRLKNEIHDYLNQRSWDKPFAAAVCGGPGSGKSLLVNALAKAEFERDPIRQNAAQWTSVEQLFRTCELVRSVHVEHKPALVFIDEVDSKVAGESLYGKLLAPLWDCCYHLGGEERKLGLPVVFLLAGSKGAWTKARSLVRAKGTNAEEKIRDLVSRLSVFPVEITPLRGRKADIVYIAARLFRKRFPAVRRIERRVLELFAEATFEHGPRSITQVIDILERPRVRGDITALDLWDPDKLGKLKMHINVRQSDRTWLAKRKDGMKPGKFIVLG